MSCKLTCSRSIAFSDASKNVAENVPRLILFAMLASVSFKPCFSSRLAKLDNHWSAVALYVAHYNLCRIHESLSPSARHQVTPAMALGITDRIWSLGELIDAALAVAGPDPTETAPERRRKVRVIDGGRTV
jgi:hypothetical protein